MKSALLKLRETQNSMSATERAVSDYLLTHQGEAMGLSIHQLAESSRPCGAVPQVGLRMAWTVI